MEGNVCDENSNEKLGNSRNSSSSEFSAIDMSVNVNDSISEASNDNQKIQQEEVLKENERAKRFCIQDYNIPELQEFDPEAVYRFLRKYGNFSRQDTLTNKERKVIRKFSSSKQNHKEKRKDKPRPKRIRYDKKMVNSNCKQRIAFDLSYFNENLMRYVDMRMCIKQLHRCYSENRKLHDPLQFHITSVVDKSEEILALNLGYINWDANFHNKSYLDVFKKEDIVYLTSESENVINTLDDSKVYIIGGLLDHNSLKGMSYQRAIANDIAHARLPINEYMDMKKLKVLPINQVYSVISLVTSGKSWSDALLLTIPQRKQPIPKVEAIPKIVTNNTS